MGYTRGDRGDKKKLSWIYRKKVKQQKLQRPKQTVTSEAQGNKDGRIIIRNLSFKATEDDVKQLYEPFGEIEEIKLLRNAANKLVGCGFVQFKHMQDASKAIFNTNKKEFLGRVINSTWAIPKAEFCEKQKNEPTETEQNANEEGEPAAEEVASKRDVDPSEQLKLKLRRQKDRKLQKERSRKKRARIVIRNLSFQTTEEDLKEHFSKYGSIEEVKILKRSDGKSVGCAFLQFEQVQSAAKAIHYANLKPLRDRPIVVDWAMSKDKFSKNNSDTVNIKEENDLDDTKDNIVEMKVEKDSDAEDENVTEERGSRKRDRTIDNENSEESDNDSVTELENVNDVKSEEDGTEASEGEEEKLDDEDDEKEMEEEKRPRRQSHDVSEGKTVFFKNVPFSVKNDQLKRYMEKFGPVHYALICMDSLTEFSKGTAFVKFKNLEDAEKCLSAGNELQIEDQVLEAHRALERNEIENQAKAKKHKEKDSRNLYLVKEGVIMAGSPAAVGVSATDMAKRLQIEQWKSQILRNLNMFVSRVRLVVYNLPPTLDDAKLRTIFERHSNPNAIVREARVMRDMKNVDAKGVGRSKEYGFVSFTNHDDALKALRDVNNNPNIFPKNRRPIVSFSIENRIMVNAKQKRIEKSREQNPLWRGNAEKRKAEETKERRDNAKRTKVENAEETDAKPYTGVISKPGKSKLRTKFNLKTQALLHQQTVKKEKKMNRVAKKQRAMKKEKEQAKKEVQVKQGKKVNPDDVNLDKLVDNYRNKLKTIQLTKSKWYEA